MKALARLGCLAGSLWIVLAVGGCGPTSASHYQSWQFERAVEEVARTSRRTGNAGAPSTVRQNKSPTVSPKTTESTKQYDERHPSRWKRKLKAAYA